MTRTPSAVIGTAAKKVGSWVLYISTEYVFDGTCPPYAPDDKKNPLNLYGQTKSDGEDELLKVPFLTFWGCSESLGVSNVVAQESLTNPTNPAILTLVSKPKT